MLQVANLTCLRGARQLFSGLGFGLAAGGLLYVNGPNGAGKTSLLRILCGLSRPEAGEIRWNGAVVGPQDDAFRQNLFYLGHQNAMQDALTVEENLNFYASLSGKAADAPTTSSALQRMGVRATQGRLVRHLSQGQKRRAALARMLLTDARLWILDEPFVALDQQAIVTLAEVMAGHLSGGGMLILTSHQPVDIGAFVPQVLELGA